MTPRGQRSSCPFCGGMGRLPYRDGSGVYLCAPCRGSGVSRDPKSEARDCEPIKDARVDDRCEGMAKPAAGDASDSQHGLSPLLRDLTASLVERDEWEERYEDLLSRCGGNDAMRDVLRDGKAEIVEGSIWERNDELFIVEKVYAAHRHARPSEGTTPGLIPITLVKFRCIDPMPNHTEVANFLEHYEPYDPEREENDA